MPYHIIPYHTMPCHIIPYHAILCHYLTMPYHIIPCPYHAIPCHCCCLVLSCTNRLESQDLSPYPTLCGVRRCTASLTTTFFTCQRPFPCFNCRRPVFFPLVSFVPVSLCLASFFFLFFSWRLLRGDRYRPGKHTCGMCHEQFCDRKDCGVASHSFGACPVGGTCMCSACLVDCRRAASFDR